MAIRLAVSHMQVSTIASAMANIKQSLFFAFIYNAAGVPIAAGALYPLAFV